MGDISAVEADGALGKREDKAIIAASRQADRRRKLVSERYPQISFLFIWSAFLAGIDCVGSIVRILRQY